MASTSADRSPGTQAVPLDNGNPLTQTAIAGSENHEHETFDHTADRWVGGSTAKLVQGLVFGTLFGFLLQKGGVAKFDILMGVLLLENFVVVQVMLTAIITGMVGVYLLEKIGLVEWQIKETVYGANVMGGLIFGAGFAMLAYCPGTNAAAIGQGNLDAIVGAVGLLFGSYLFALSSNFQGGAVSKWGKRGKTTLADLVGVSRGVFIAMAVPVLVGVLVLLEMYLQ